MTWTSYRNRGETLRAMIDAADARQDGLLPRDVPGFAEAFDTDADALGALLLRWHTRLAGRIEREILADPDDLPRSVVSAWRLTAQELPGVRAIIDRYRGLAAAGELEETLETALAKSAAKERSLLALMAGLASGEGAATVAVGARLEEEARSVVVAAPAPTELARPSLIDRLRAAIAA